MDISQVLMSIGLTQQESNVYISLLSLQESKTGKLCEHTHIPSSNIYQILSSLMNKGLVSFKMKNNIKIFMPSLPETLNELFLEKQKNLEEQRKGVIEAIAQLKKIELEEESYSNYKYYEGVRGVKSMWQELIEKNKNTEIKVYTGSKTAYELLTGFFDEQHKRRILKNIRAKIIFNINDKSRALKRKKLPLTSVRFLELNNLSEWGVLGDYFFMMYVSTKVPRAFLIKDKIFSFTFNQTFGQLWERARQG